MKPRVAAVAVAATVFLAGAAAAPAADPPSRAPALTLTSAKVSRAKNTVSLRMRLCASRGPRARLVTRESRRVRGRVVARRKFYSPLGTDLPGPVAYACSRRYQASWLVPRRLLKAPGRFRVSLRLVDAYGQTTRPVTVTFG